MYSAKLGGLDAPAVKCHITGMGIRTNIYTFFNGELVGEDENANRYYRGKGRHLQGRERRWVVYKGGDDPSNVPPEWHAWLHHTVAESLAQEAAAARDWQKPHQANLSGSEDAYRPPGHQLAGRARHSATGDYIPWTPK